MFYCKIIKSSIQHFILSPYKIWFTGGGMGTKVGSLLFSDSNEIHVRPNKKIMCVSGNGSENFR